MSDKSTSTSAVGATSSVTQGSSREAKDKYHVLIGCTGSVASIKVPLLVKELLKTNKVSEIHFMCRVYCTMTGGDVTYLVFSG